MRKIALLTALLSVSLPAPALEVLTTIKPLAFIAAAITDGVSEPKVLLPVGASPHDFALRPSDLRRIQQADLVLWVGPALEGFMTKPLARHPHALALSQAKEMAVFRYQVGEGHDYEEHDEDGHDHHDIDPHIWLGPAQAKTAASLISQALSQQDPANSLRYQQNLARFNTQVDAQDKALASKMQHVSEKGYFVFHEAYGYWERHYGMQSKGHFTVHPEQRPGAKTLVALRDALKQQKVSCIYAEPQFSPAVIESVARNTGAKVLLLDEVGEKVAISANSYPQFMQQLADSFSQCL